MSANSDIQVGLSSIRLVLENWYFENTFNHTGNCHFTIPGNARVGEGREQNISFAL